ncbi:coiled-coil domain-containing protein 62 [Xyrauchen texanus]|uniref:coiled-coil domain-containing protein 62 n=1 Tax=Xyrauchen texanus TaxID=154827 RepID=UPI00224225BF|nr:coiled-coil domain-containing protein 62 [Xyrauchen texanus]
MEGEQDIRNSKTSGNLSMSRGYTVLTWHSTTVNKTSANGLESSTVQRQQLELQLLIAELKDRDVELNNLAVAHHRQLLSWEQDRQRVLILEQRCARLKDGVQKCNDVIRDHSKRTMVMEARDEDVHRELNSTQQELHELSQRELNTTRHQQDLEAKNQSLNSTIMMLSTQVGQLQVREEELNSMLKLKDKDVIGATDHIFELSGHLFELEKSLEELQTRESKTLRETEEHKHCFREGRHENTQLRADLQEKTIVNNIQREEVFCLKQENQLLKKEHTAVELQLLSEDKSWKDELLELSQSKQARAESESECLRQVCENQQNDLQLLKLNLESAREKLRTCEGQRSHGSASDLSCLHLDCPSPQSGRCPACLHDSALSIEFNSNEKGYSSSTSRLQRLLADSLEMVASLEN